MRNTLCLLFLYLNYFFLSIPVRLLSYPNELCAFGRGPRDLCCSFLCPWYWVLFLEAAGAAGAGIINLKASVILFTQNQGTRQSEAWDTLALPKRNHADIMPLHLHNYHCAGEEGHPNTRTTHTHSLTLFSLSKCLHLFAFQRSQINMKAQHLRKYTRTAQSGESGGKAPGKSSCENFKLNSN